MHTFVAPDLLCGLGIAVWVQFPYDIREAILGVVEELEQVVLPCLRGDARCLWYPGRRGAHGC